MVKELSKISDGRHHVHLILPFEITPHLSELYVGNVARKLNDLSEFRAREIELCVFWSSSECLRERRVIQVLSLLVVLGKELSEVDGLVNLDKVFGAGRSRCGQLVSGIEAADGFSAEHELKTLLASISILFIKSWNSLSNDLNNSSHSKNCTFYNESKSIESKIKRLLTNFKSWRSENTKNIHHESLKNFLIAGGIAKLNQSIQNNQLHIVIALFHNKIDVSRCSGFDCSWSVGESDESSSSFVSRIKYLKIVNASDEASALIRIIVTHFVNQLNDNQLQYVSERSNLIDASGQVVESTSLINMKKHHESVTLAGSILFCLKIFGDELRCIRNQEFEVLWKMNNLLMSSKYDDDREQKRRTVKDGEWACVDAKCAKINEETRQFCDDCGKAKPRAKSKIGKELGKEMAEKSKGLFAAEDWVCSKCGNVNWARRKTCNVCNAPKLADLERRTGYGGGYMDREDVEYIKRDYDEEFDEFGRKKKKKGEAETSLEREDGEESSDELEEKVSAEQRKEDMEDEEDEEEEDGEDLAKYDFNFDSDPELIQKVEELKTVVSSIANGPSQCDESDCSCSCSGGECSCPDSEDEKEKERERRKVHKSSRERDRESYRKRSSSRDRDRKRGKRSRSRSRDRHRDDRRDRKRSRSRSRDRRRSRSPRGERRRDDERRREKDRRRSRSRERSRR
ncbi:hypothetical protein GCK72_006752 [Caenorhabditis remanei]|uniref:RanBP2-type domain-containing protein n=2 Tax=Caenorhabditis remanei TaxID=31234 RepID=A0A6A5HJM0_CAERE|nr:hypothetical protein GCK72_006752 [Caenorhabditis remanei]KAF1766794.1 hypothetical protein GCK72_006752 [Caenorhabditis remanei]